MDLTGNEWIAANQLGPDYNLYLVASVRNAPTIAVLTNPVEALANGELIVEPSAWRITWPSVE